MFMFAALLLVAVAALQFTPNAQNTKSRSNFAKWRRAANMKTMPTPIREGNGAIS